jgi:Domain of unknown function (DUF4268)
MNAQPPTVKRQFWQALTQRARISTPGLHPQLEVRQTGHDHYLKAIQLEEAVFLNYGFTRSGTKVELFLGPGGTLTRKQQIFNRLSQNRDRIEADFQHPLIWQELENGNDFRICNEMMLGTWKDPNIWPTLQDEMIQRMSRLRTALSPFFAGDV